MLIPDGHMNMSLWELLREIFWHAKDLVMSPEVDPNAGETQPRSYNDQLCTHECPAFYDVLQCSYNYVQTLGECGLLNRVSIGP